MVAPPKLKRRSKRDPEGRMALVDHLRELRNRFLIAAGAIVLATIPGWLLYQPALVALQQPLIANGGRINMQGLTDPFSVQMQVAIAVAMVISSPIWVYEIWAFIVPGLTKREKRTAAAFMLTAIPLFLGGCYLGFRTLPTAVNILLAFTPLGADNLIPASDYIGFTTRFIIAFGCSFLMPIFLVALNLIHILPARIMLKGWRFAVIAIFIFAAILTPTPDPYTMLSLALPMVGLYFAAYAVARTIDAGRARRHPDFSHLSDDEASPLDDRRYGIDDVTPL